MYGSNKSYKGHGPNNFSEQLNAPSSDFDAIKNSRRESGSMSSKQSEWLPLHHYRNAREQEYGSRPLQHPSLLASTPIYSENEIQFRSSSLQNKIGSFSETLYAESLREKAKLGLLDPIDTELAENYGRSSSLYSPGHQSWSDMPTSSSVGGMVNMKQFQTNIAKLQKDHISDDPLYVSNSLSLNAKAERPTIQPISNLKLESIDDEDEYLYGDSNSVPEPSVKEKSKPVEEIPVKSESVWSDEEEFSDLYGKSNSRESSERRSERKEVYKPMSNTDRAFSQISKDKKSAIPELDDVKPKLPPHDKSSKSKTSHSNPQTFTLNLKNKSGSFTNFSDETKLKDVNSESKSAVSAKKKSSQVPLKEPPSEKRSKYSAATELARKKGSEEKPGDSVKKKLLDDRKSQKYSEREVRSKQQISEKEVSIPSPSRLEKIFVNINRDESFSKKRTVLVKETADSFPDLDDCEIEASLRKEASDRTKFNVAQKDKLGFSFAEKYSGVAQRTVRNLSDSPTLKRVVHNTALNPAKETHLSKTVVVKEGFKIVKNLNDLTIPKPQDVTVLEKKVVTNIKEKGIKKNSATEIPSVSKHLLPKKYLLSDKSQSHHEAEASSKYYGSRERSPRRHSRERSPRRHSRERSPRRHSRERRSRRHSRERYYGHYSRERSPRHYSHESSPRHHSYESSPRDYSHERSPRRHSRERSPRYHSYERSPKRYESDLRYEDYKSRGWSGSSYTKHDPHEPRRSHKEFPHGKSQLDENLYKSYAHERDLNEGLLEQSSEESPHSSPERRVRKKNRGFPESKSSKLPLSDSIDASHSEREDDLTKKLALLRKAKMITDSGTKGGDLEKSLPVKEEAAVKVEEDSDENDVNEDITVSEVSSAKAQGIQKISFVINRKQLPAEVSHPVENPLVKNEAPVSGIPSIIPSPSVQPPVQPPVQLPVQPPVQPPVPPAVPFQQYGYSPMVPSGYPPGSFPYSAVPPAPPMMPYGFPPTIPTYYSAEIDPSPKIGKRPVHRVCSLKNIPTVSDVKSVASHEPTSAEYFSETQAYYNQGPPVESPATDSRDYTNSDASTEPAHQTMKKSGLIQISCKQSPTKQNVTAQDVKAAVNVHIETYQKLLEDRNQLLKKLKMHNKTVSDLDAAKTSIESKCGKVKSVFEKQTISQFESLIEKTKLELTRVIEMSRNVTSEIQKVKAKIPAQLLSQIQESTKTTEPEPESSVTYNFFDPGNHWCQHCNKVFATIQVLLQHYHTPGHPPCFDFLKKPWHAKEKEKESTNPDQSKEAKLESVKGVEFLVPVSGYYCSLCDETLPDANFAEKHVKSHSHFLKFKNYTKENPVYEKIKILVRNFEQARFQREVKKRELEEKQLSAMKRQKVLAEKEKEIKAQIAIQEEKEKKVAELNDDSVSDQHSKKDDGATNIKLNLVDEKGPDVSKQVKPAAKPNFIGRAPNYKNRLKNKAPKDGSPFDVKNAAESKAVGKQIQVIVAGAVSPPKVSSQLGKVKAEKETKPKEVAKIQPSVKTNSSAVKKNAEKAGTAPKLTVQLSEIKLPPTPPPPKKDADSKAHTRRTKHSVEEERDFLMLGINRNDFEPLAVPKPPPANLIQAPSFNGAQGMCPVNIPQSAPQAVQYASTPVPAFNPSYPPPDNSRNAVQATLPIPPFPPPLQVPPPNVVLKYAQSNVPLPAPAQHNLAQYPVTAPPKFQNVPSTPTLNMPSTESSFDQHSPTQTGHQSCSGSPPVNVTAKNSASDRKTGNKSVIPSEDNVCVKSGKTGPSSAVKRDTRVQASSDSPKKEGTSTKKMEESKTNVEECKMSVSKSTAGLKKNNENSMKDNITEKLDDEPEKIISTDVDFGAFFTMSTITREKQRAVEDKKSVGKKELCIKNTSCTEKNNVSSSVPKAKKRKYEQSSVSDNSDAKSDDVQLDKLDENGSSIAPPNTSASEPSLEGSHLPEITKDESLSKSTTDVSEIADSVNDENMSCNQTSEAEKGKCELQSVSTNFDINSSDLLSDKSESPGKNISIDPHVIPESEPLLEDGNLTKAKMENSCVSKTTTDETETAVSLNTENQSSNQQLCDSREDKENAKGSQKEELSTSCEEDLSLQPQTCVSKTTTDETETAVSLNTEGQSSNQQLCDSREDKENAEGSQREELSTPCKEDLSLQPLKENNSEKSHSHSNISGNSSSLENTSGESESIISQSSESGTISQTNVGASDASCNLEVIKEDNIDTKLCDEPFSSENKSADKPDTSTSKGSESIISQSSESGNISQTDVHASDESCNLEVTEENSKDTNLPDTPSLSVDKDVDTPNPSTSKGSESIILQSSESGNISQTDVHASDESCNLEVTEENSKDTNLPDTPSLSVDKDVNTPDTSTSKGSESIILQSSESGNISQTDVHVSDESCNLNVNEENSKDTNLPDTPSLSVDKDVDTPDTSTSKGSESIISQSSESGNISQTDVHASDESCNLNVTEGNIKDTNLPDTPSLSVDKSVVKPDTSTSKGSESIILQSSEGGNISQTDVQAGDKSCNLKVIEEDSKNTNLPDTPSLSVDKFVEKPHVSNVGNEAHNFDSGIDNLTSQSVLTTESGIKSELSSNAFLNETNTNSNLVDERTNLVSSISDIEPKVESVTVDQDVTPIKKDVKTEDQQNADDKKQVFNTEVQSQPLIPPVTLAIDVKNSCKSQSLEKNFSPSYKSEGTIDEDPCSGDSHSKKETEQSSSDVSAATEPEKDENLVEKLGEGVQNLDTISSEESSCSAKFSCPPESEIDNKNLESVVSETPSISKTSSDGACVVSSTSTSSGCDDCSKEENSVLDGTSTTLDLQTADKVEHQNNNLHILTEQDTPVNGGKSQNFNSENSQKQDLQCSQDTPVDNVIQSSTHLSPTTSILNEQNSGTEAAVTIPDLTPNATSSSVDSSGIKSPSTGLSTVGEEGTNDENINDISSIVDNAPTVTENASSVSQCLSSEDLAAPLSQKSDDKLTSQRISDDLSKSETISHQASVSETFSQDHEVKGNEVEKMTEKNVVESSAVEESEVQEENVSEKNENCDNELAKVDDDKKIETSVPAETIASISTKEEPESCELVSDINEENKEDCGTMENISEDRK